MAIVDKTEEEVLTDEIGGLVDIEPVVDVEEKPDEKPEEKPIETPQEDEKKPDEDAEVKPEDKPEEEEEPAKPAEEALPLSDTLEEEPAEEAGEWTPPSREEYDNLLTTMNTMAGKISLAGPSRETPSATPAEEKPKETPKVEVEVEEPVLPSLEPIEFVADEDAIYELTRDPKKFNELMNKVVSEAHNRAVLLTTQNVLTSIPKIVGSSIEQATSIQRAADEFYKTNEDLIPFKSFVMMVTNEIAAANPDKQLNELLGDIAVEARKKLNLKERAVVNKKKEDEKSPAFVKAKGTRRTPASKPVGLQAEIDNILA